MRSMLFAVLVACLVISVTAHAADLEPQPAPVQFRVTHGASMARITVTDGAALPFEQPVVRFVPLPDGTRNPRASVSGAGTDQAVTVEAGALMVLRGVTLLPLRIERSAGDMPAIDVPATVEIDIRYTGGSGAAMASAAGASPAAAHSRGFYTPYLDLFPDNDRERFLSSGTEGAYLILAAPEFVDAILPLAAWKREMGFEVSIITTNDTGTRNDEIQTYLRDLYQAADVPPQYLLLVGDVEQIPGWDYHQSVSDLPYGLMEGDDFLPDVEVGRLSAQNTDDVATIVAKFLRYEQDPYRDDEAWFSRALLVAGNYSSSTPVPVSRWCRTQLFDIGYAEVDSCFYPPHWSTGRLLVKNSIDAGVSLVSYRGWAYGWRGWEPPHFTVDEIPTLNNGWMLPAVFSFVCLNNNYLEPECFGESWLRAGDVETPRGAIAFIGNSEHWSHTRYNDAAAIGTFQAMNDHGLRRLGGILNAAKYGVMNQFTTQMLYETHGDESVEFYFYIYSLLGDPAMELWMAPPQDLVVEHVDTIPQGSNMLEVQVYEDDGVTPVAGLRVGVSQGTRTLGCVRTDAMGQALVLADFEQTGEPVKVAVTGNGCAAYRDSLDVMTGDPFLAIDAVAITDDGSGQSQGNGDGVVNPGETLEVMLDLRNRGGDTATGVSAELTAVRGAAVDQGAVSFPDIVSSATGTAQNPCVVTIDSHAEDGLAARFRLLATAGPDDSDNAFDLFVVAPDLRFESHALASGTLDPGATEQLDVTLRNDGSVASTTTDLILRAVTPALATVEDSTATIGPIPIDGTAVTQTPFSIVAGNEAAVGQAAVFTLHATTAEDYESVTSFSIVLGTVDQRAPQGPDAYGYYAYDSSDTDYPDAVPLYDWINCSAAYGGNGTRLDLADNKMTTVALPFTFTFYGEDYDYLAISDNGWASFDTTAYYDFYNWGMPNTYGNGALLAGFWDNLDPTKEYNEQLVGDGIYTLDDSENDRFVVEWSRIGNLRTQHENHEDWDDLQTFQIVLLDPLAHPTPTGDGIVLFQYKQVVNNDTERMFCTIGIENEAETTGLQYTYDNIFQSTSAPLAAGLAIQFSTIPPRYSPFALQDFAATATAEGIRLSWEPIDARPRGGYRIYRATDGETYALLPGGRLGADARSFLDTTADPDAGHAYTIGSLDPVGVETRFGPYRSGGAATPLRLSLQAVGENPFRGSTMLSYSLPSLAPTRLEVYSVSGRLVRTLVEGNVARGNWTAHWDGRDQHGHELPSGIYFGRLQAGAETRALKLTLLR